MLEDRMVIERRIVPGWLGRGSVRFCFLWVAWHASALQRTGGEANMKKICELLLPSFVTALLFWVMLGLLHMERLGPQWQLLGAFLIIVTLVLLGVVVSGQRKGPRNHAK